MRLLGWALLFVTSAIAQLQLPGIHPGLPAGQAPVFSRTGGRPTTPVAPASTLRPYRGRGGVVVAYPYYLGYPGYFGDPYPPAPYDADNYPNPGANNVDPSVVPPSPPPIVINQYFSAGPLPPSPQGWAIQQVPPQQPQDGAVAPPPGGQPGDSLSPFAIVLKDHTIYSVVVYWVEGTTLNCLTSDNVRKRIPLAEVDRSATRELNDKQNLEVRLPPEN